MSEHDKLQDESKSSAFIFLGEKAPSDFDEQLNEFLNEKYPNLEVTALDGGQEKEELDKHIGEFVTATNSFFCDYSEQIEDELMIKA